MRLQVFLVLAAVCSSTMAGGGGRFMYSSCGTARYDPTAEFCCGKTVVPASRRDLLCCNDVIVNNPAGSLLCCNTQSYDPRRELCVNGVVLEYVNVDRTVFQRPTHRLTEFGHDGSVTNFVGAKPRGLADHQGVAAREIEIPADPDRRATVRDVYGQDVLNCNGKFHRLTDPSQYGYFSCCGNDVYNWLYYTCVNNRVVMVQDAPWPHVTRDATTDLKPVVPAPVGTLPASFAAASSGGGHLPAFAAATSGIASVPTGLGFSSHRVPTFPGVTVLATYPSVIPPPSGCYVRCGVSKWFHLAQPFDIYRCCGDNLVDTTQFQCSPVGYTEPNVLLPGGDLVSFNRYRLNHFNPTLDDAAPLALASPYLPPLAGPRQIKPYCEQNKLVGGGDSLAYDCCGNALYSTKTHFCCGSFIHERKSGQLCCNGVYSDNSSGYISCCGRTPYDIRTYVCRRDQENN